MLRSVPGDTMLRAVYSSRILVALVVLLMSKQVGAFLLRFERVRSAREAVARTLTQFRELTAIQIVLSFFHWMRRPVIARALSL